MKFTEKSAQILIDQEIDGAGLLTIQSIEKLEFYGFLGGPASKLWAAIEKLKKAQTTTPPKGKTYEILLEVNVVTF